jgi:hypothetical protein
MTHLHSDNPRNEALPIKKIVSFLPNDHATMSLYSIQFTMKNGLRSEWLYRSKEKRDADYERIAKEFEAAEK